MTEYIDGLLTRRTVVAAALGEPGPDEAQLNKILIVATRTPDHKKLFPWRFILFQGEARARFGEVLAATYAASEQDPSPVRKEVEADRFMRAPVVIAVISKPLEHPAVPVWEQTLSAGAVCQNVLHAANALGFSAQWITEWYAYDETIRQALGLSENEKVAGFIYIGTAKEKPAERPRPDLNELVTAWSSTDR